MEHAFIFRALRYLMIESQIAIYSNSYNYIEQNRKCLLGNVHLKKENKKSKRKIKNLRNSLNLILVL